MVDQLANEYAGRPVVFIEYDMQYRLMSREGRWWAAYGGSSAAFPMVMVDSGQQFMQGPQDYHAAYKAMVDAALARPAQGRMTAQWSRVGDRIHLEVQLTNETSTILSGANDARVHAIVYEDTTVNTTSRLARTATYVGITGQAPAATASYVLETGDLSGVDWGELHVIALADYRPGGSLGPYDMIQAAVATFGGPQTERVYLPCLRSR